MTSRTIGSKAATARGVNTRLTRARMRSCSGGSIMIMDRYRSISLGSLVSMDRSTPWVLVKVGQSLWAVHTSS